MAARLGPDSVRQLLAERESPCVSVYMSLEATFPGRKRNAIVYRNLLREVEDALERDHPPRRREFIERLRALDGDDLWREGGDGVAVFLAPDHFSFHHLPERVDDLAVVGRSFHTRPLLEIIGSRRPYHVVAVGRNRVALYDGWGRSVSAAHVPGLPGKLEDVVRKPDLDRSNVHFHAGRAGDSAPVYHSPGDQKAELEADLARYFRAIDDAVLAHLAGSRDPVVLATQSHYAPIYRRGSRLTTLLDEGIACEPERVAEDELGRRGCELIERRERGRIGDLLARCEEARSKGRGSDDLAEIAAAAAAGRVETLFVAARRHVWGRLDRATGEIVQVDADRTAAEGDILDELAEVVIEKNGEVLFFEETEAPGESPVAAIYRY